MTEIDLEKWKRREHFAFFYRMDYPQYNVSFNVDITEFLSVIKQKKLSFYFTLIYLSTHSVNQIEEFKYRVRDGKVFLHDTLNPSFAHMEKDSDLFKQITVDSKDNLMDFIDSVMLKIKLQKEYFVAADFASRDDYIYYTSLPWISFTHLSHTINFNKNDSVPRLAWGKYFEQNSRILLPYSVQVNHAFVDGIHIAKFKENLEDNLRSFAGK